MRSVRNSPSSQRTPHNSSRFCATRISSSRAKEGANVYYSVTDRTIFKLLDVAREIFNNHLAGVQNILEEIRLDQPKRAARR